jgi:cytidylate kinase
MVAFIKRVVDRAASEGNCVIVGRGSTYSLRDRDDAYHVFIYAPWEEKMRRLREAGKSRTEAEELLSTIDRERAIFIQRYFGKEWPNRHLYHLMINSKIGDDQVIEAILHEVAALNAAPVYS